MALRTKLRSLYLHRHRLFSTSILSPDSKTPLTSTEKSRAALSLLRFEKNPERILDICRAASLTPELHSDRVAFSMAINKLKESNYYEGIRGLFKDFLSQQTFNTERYVSHFIILYGQAGLVSDAIKLFDEMRKLGIERTTKALNSLLFACVLAGDYGELKRIFSEFPQKYKLEPDLVTYNTLLKGFCESGNANSAHSILAEMERKGIQPNATTFSVVIGGFYKEKKLGEADKMMDLMKELGVRPGISIYNVMLQGLCKLKKLDEAKALLDDILARGMKPNSVTYGHLVFGFCREGKLDAAKTFFKEMVCRKLKPEAGCYFTLVYYLCKGQDFEAALEICKESMAKGWVPNMATMKSLVDGLVSIEQVDEAKELIGVVKEKFERNVDKWTEIEEGLPK